MQLIRYKLSVSVYIQVFKTKAEIEVVILWLHSFLVKSSWIFSYAHALHFVYAYFLFTLLVVKSINRLINRQTELFEQRWQNTERNAARWHWQPSVFAICVARAMRCHRLPSATAWASLFEWSLKFHAIINSVFRADNRMQSISRLGCLM